jgi:Fe-S cluster biogenesis protein NfuA
MSWACPVPRPRARRVAGTGGGGLELVANDGPIVKVRISGPAASVMTVRVAVTQKLREKFPAIAAVQLVN